jgi:hypothetical protein
MISDDATITSERTALLRLAAAAESTLAAVTALDVCPFCVSSGPEHDDACPAAELVSALDEVLRA